jgi:hypothetical protein
MDTDTARAIRDLATSGRLSDESVEAVATVLDTEPEPEPEPEDTKGDTTKASPKGTAAKGSAR